MDLYSIIQTNSFFIKHLTITLLCAAFAVFCLILRYRRIKKGNVVCRKNDFWFCTILALASPAVIIISNINHSLSTFSRYTVFAVIACIILIVRWVNGTITFYDDGFVSTNEIFMKKFYPYDAVVALHIVSRTITPLSTERRNRYRYRYPKRVDFADILVRKENSSELKTISIEVESHNFFEFRLMLDKKCPQIHYKKRNPADNNNNYPMNFYNENNGNNGIY